MCVCVCMRARVSECKHQDRYTFELTVKLKTKFAHTIYSYELMQIMHENRDFKSSSLNILCVYERIYKSMYNKHDSELNICFMYHVCTIEFSR